MNVSSIRLGGSAINRGVLGIYVTEICLKMMGVYEKFERLDEHTA